MAKRKILIVDDEPHLLELLKERLEHNDYEVLYLNCGKDAVKVTTEQQPDLVILDIMLPDKNGYDICYEIKHSDQTAAIPVIIFTAKEDWKGYMNEMCTYVKADDFVAKPFEAEELLKKIRKLIKE